MRLHRWQPTRLLRPCNSPGNNTGLGCHCLLQCMNVRRKVKSLSRARLLVTPWTAAYQAPPPMGFSRQEYWSGVPLPPPTYTLDIDTFFLMYFPLWLSYILFNIIFHYGLSQDIEYSSLCYIKGFCCLSIIYIIEKTNFLS